MIHDCTGVVLAGGASRRMGRDKAEITICGETMLARACRVLGEAFDEVICVGRTDDAARLPIASVPDERPGMGPLAGIETALLHAAGASVFVVACDMPMLSTEAIERIWRLGNTVSANAIVPVLGGRIHPLAAFYRKDVLPAAREALDARRLSVTQFVREIGACLVDIDDDEAIAPALMNVNDPAELERVTSQMDGGGPRS